MKPRISKFFKEEQIKQLIKDYDIRSAVDVQQVVKELTANILQSALNSELDETLGYERNNQNSREISDNYRNGYQPKTVKSSQGEIELQIPRDRNGEHIPIIVPRGAKDISDIEQKIISMYARGISTREINETMHEIYGINADPTMVSRITDKLLPTLGQILNILVINLILYLL
ncbi:MAG: transposase [Mycoplasmataceae bacterium]|jgi:transposase-like protein|nr:transposase [Mycoplasmataceae bacterium]